MAEPKKRSRIHSLGTKIALLPSLGLLGLLFNIGIIYYLNTDVNQALRLERKASAVIQDISNLLRLESEYIKRLDPAELKKIQVISSGISISLKESGTSSRDSGIGSLFNKMEQLFAEHDLLFEQDRRNISEYQESRAILTSHYQNCETFLHSIIELVTQEETTLIMSGEELGGNMIGLRDTVKEYLTHFSALLLNLTDVFAFGDVGQYESRNQILYDELALTTKNLNGMVASVESEEIVTTWDKIQLEQENFQKVQNHLFELWRKGRELDTKLVENTNDIQKTVTEIAAGTAKEMSRIQDQQKWLGLIATGTVFAILILVSYIIVRRITRPVLKMTQAIETMAEGDISIVVDINSRDELGRMAEALERMILAQREKVGLAELIADGELSREVIPASDRDALGQALKKMVDSLNRILRQVDTTGSQVSSGSGQVSDSSQALSQGATEQAASIEEITSTMTEIGAQVQTNADNSAQAKALAHESKTLAEEGNEQMKDLVEAMGHISDSSKEIAKIIKTVDDIAFQTNLLALNAAVEAARAGKHGKGFAVVAQEVRNLAAKSAKAAQETALLIDGSVKKVDAGSIILGKTNQSLEEIVGSAAKLLDLVGEIAAASNEQSLGINQVNQGLDQVEQVTQQNTAAAEETASAAVELSGLAYQLHEILQNFKLMDNMGEYDPGPGRQPVVPTKRLLSSTSAKKIQPLEKPVSPSDYISLDEGEWG